MNKVALSHQHTRLTLCHALGLYTDSTHTYAYKLESKLNETSEGCLVAPKMLLQSLNLTPSPQEDLRALQVCARGARRALGAGPAGKDDDQTGVRLPETLHLR